MKTGLYIHVPVSSFTITLLTFDLFIMQCRMNMMINSSYIASCKMLRYNYVTNRKHIKKKVPSIPDSENDLFKL